MKRNTWMRTGCLAALVGVASGVGAQPVLVTTITEPTVTADSHFGWAMGTDGSTLAIANRRVVVPDDTSQSTVYIYEDNGAGGWTHVQTIGGFTTDDQVWEIAVDGDTLAISDKVSDIYENNGGVVWMYHRDPVTGIWPTSPSQTLSPPASPGPCPNFGQSIAISGDLMVIGAHGREGNNGERTGGAYSYQRVNASSPWHLVGHIDPGFTTSYLQPGNPCTLTLEVPRFGTSVAADAGRVVISSAGATISDDPFSGTHDDDDWGFLAYNESDLSVTNPGIDPLLSPSPFETVLEFGPATDDTYGQQIALRGSLIAVGNRGKLGHANEGVIVYYGDGGSPEQWDTNTPVLIDNPLLGIGGTNIAGKIDFSEDIIVASTNSQITPELTEGYVFRRNMGGCEGWGLVAELTDPDLKPLGSVSLLSKLGSGLANKRDIEMFGRTVVLAGAWDEVGTTPFAGAVYIYTIPDCPGDIDGDLDADPDDLNTFATLFLANDPAADVNCDGNWNLDDINDFADMFLLGCS